MEEFLDFGGQARIVAVDERTLDKTWLARLLDSTVTERFQALGIDPCGEYGEYHTVVEWAPGFAHAIRLHEEGRYDFSGYVAADLSLISR